MTTYELPNGIGYRPPAEDRVYSPPTEPETFTAPRVTASAVEVDGSVIEQAHAAFTNAKTAFEKFLNDIPREHYSADGLTAQIKKFAATDAARAVDTAVANVRDRADAAAKQVNKIKRDLSPHGDTAAELRATRFWDRTQPLLDNAKEGAFGRAQKLIANANREELGTLLQELPAYLEALGQPANWIDTAVGQGRGSQRVPGPTPVGHGETRPDFTPGATRSPPTWASSARRFRLTFGGSTARRAMGIGSPAATWATSRCGTRGPRRPLRFVPEVGSSCMTWSSFSGGGTVYTHRATAR